MKMDVFSFKTHPIGAVSVLLALLIFLYLFHINRLLASTPDEVHRLTPERWTRERLKETYKRLENSPITPETYKDKLPPRLDRRYVVTGGSGTLPPMESSSAGGSRSRCIQIS